MWTRNTVLVITSVIIIMLTMNSWGQTTHTHTHWSAQLQKDIYLQGFWGRENPSRWKEAEWSLKLHVLALFVCLFIYLFNYFIDSWLLEIESHYAVGNTLEFMTLIPQRYWDHRNVSPHPVHYSERLEKKRDCLKDHLCPLQHETLHSILASIQKWQFSVVFSHTWDQRPSGLRTGGRW